MSKHNYYVYIITNRYKNVLYTGVTNNLEQRLTEHFLNKGNTSSFAGKYRCYFLVYYERHQQIMQAIEREKTIKGWNRDKKQALIGSFNPEWKFLNIEVMDIWPPEGMYSRSDK